MTDEPRTDSGRSAPATACHIVQVVQTEDRNLAWSSPTLPPEILEKLRAMFWVQRRGTWSEPSRHDHFGKLATFANQHRLGPLALVWNIPDLENPAENVRPPLEIPQPLEVPFAPVHLDRSSELTTTLRSAGQLRQWLSLRPPRAEASARRRIHGYFVRFVATPLLTVLYLIVATALIPVLLVGLSVYHLYRLVIRTDWYIAPGCAIRRLVLVWGSRPQVRVFTPVDCILVVMAQQHGWHARFWHKSGEYRTLGFDDDACASLLMAWQSTLPAPRANELIDYG